MPKTIGIIGGMGCKATILFLQTVLDKNPVKHEQDQIRMLVDICPTIPNRHQSINGIGPDASQPLTLVATNLQSIGADFLVMVCNTAHYYHDVIAARVDIPFLSMINSTISRVPDTCNSVGIMAAEGILYSRLYQDKLVELGFECIIWDDDQIAEFMGLMFKIKTDPITSLEKDKMIQLAKILLNRGVDCLILGCTEIPLVLDVQELDILVLDSLQILAEDSVHFANSADI
eukprot:TRINITY_DN2253_c0_g3_i1.p1 TRINITY_DN2253_c0_g3~~TRINITY_DN2253_c0_g3_i1.p1  ORF type:complete len:231 (-),score=36.18 TRINITY_DN2253_c0_g3_i1:246-938(-)